MMMMVVMMVVVVMVMMVVMMAVTVIHFGHTGSWLGRLGIRRFEACTGIWNGSQKLGE